MGTFMILHNFWVEQAPMFNDFQVVYYILDLVTILAFFRILFSLSSLFFSNRGDF